MLFVAAAISSQESDLGSERATRTGEESVLGEAPDESTLLIGESVAQNQEPIAPFSFWDLLRMILVLAVVIGVIYLLFFFLRRAGGKRNASSPMIRVLGSQSLPGNRVLYLVEVGEQVFLVGSGGEALNLIAEITDRETIDRLMLGAGESGQNGRRSFAEMLGGMFGGDGSLSFMRSQRDRLRKLDGRSDG